MDRRAKGYFGEKVADNGSKDDSQEEGEKLCFWHGDKITDINSEEYLSQRLYPFDCKMQKELIEGRISSI
ncbi:hypothetical protein FACS1894176_09000 [Bacteroidia bacterium]|nr:hypothetical protein FACS189428_1630 [Clostridia bacterium]GHV27274.1 hypothetical protein FACS1894176_09000 [Bacteroidia bacterium]